MIFFETRIQQVLEDHRAQRAFAFTRADQRYRLRFEDGRDVRPLFPCVLHDVLPVIHFGGAPFTP